MRGILGIHVMRCFMGMGYSFIRRMGAMAQEDFMKENSRIIVRMVMGSNI